MDEAEASSLVAPLQSVRFQATGHHAEDAGGSNTSPSPLHLGKLPLSFVFPCCLCFSILSGLIFIFPGGLTKAIGNIDENPDDPLGVDLARIGLRAPPRPPLGGMTPRPSSPGLDGGEGCFLLLVFRFCIIFCFGLANFLLLF